MRLLDCILAQGLLAVTLEIALSRPPPVAVAVFPHQTTAVPGLFAMGPLIGDNFVRGVT